MRAATMIFGKSGAGTSCGGEGRVWGIATGIDDRQEEFLGATSPHVLSHSGSMGCLLVHNMWRKSFLDIQVFLLSDFSQILICPLASWLYTTKLYISCRTVAGSGGGRRSGWCRWRVLWWEQCLTGHPQEELPWGMRCALPEELLCILCSPEGTNRHPRNDL